MNPTGMTSRRQFLSRTGAAASAMVLSQFLGLTLAADRRAKANFVFIFADDLGWGDLGCYGNREIKTPNLDRLAEEGLLFTHFYVSGSVCSPSRAAIMTGRFPARLGVHGHFQNKANAARGMPDWLDPQVPTITSLLKSGGYATGHFGKWHLGAGTDAPDPGEYGIDEHRTTNSSGPELFPEGGSSAEFKSVSTQRIVDLAIAFIEKHRNDPFYLNVWTLVPHAPLNPTPDQMEPYKRFAPGEGVPYPSAKQIYYSSVSDLDEQIGRLVRRIDELGLRDDTFIIFSSDNGPEDIHIVNAGHSGIGDAGPFRGRKRSLYEGGIREPLIVRCPGRTPAGKVDDRSILGGVDWLPTICGLAGIAPSPNLAIDGQNMSESFLGTPVKRDQPLMWEWRFPVFGDMVNKSPMLAIRQDNWKLLMNPDRSRIELYDVAKDPTELDNLADGNAEVVQRLSDKLLEWQKTLPPSPVTGGAGADDYPWPKDKQRTSD